MLSIGLALAMQITKEAYMVMIAGNIIFDQIKTYSDQIKYWEEKLETNTYGPGQYGPAKDNIKKTWASIDTLLDKYNMQKKVACCT